MAWWDNAIDRRVPSALLRSVRTEEASILKVAFSLTFYEVYMVMDNSEDLLVIFIIDMTYRMDYRLFKTGFKTV